MLRFLSGRFDQTPMLSAAPQVLTIGEAEQVSNGRYKIAGGPPITVYYDDGITLVTSDPSKNTP